MAKESSNTDSSATERVAFSISEVAKMFGRERTWVYRQINKGRISPIIGFGAAMIPASEVERVLNSRLND